MSRANLRTYVAGLLAGIPGEGPDDPDVAIFEKQPKIDDFGDCVIITKLTSREVRKAVPRGGGRKQISTKMTLVIGAERPESEAAVDRTDFLVEEVTARLRAAPLPHDNGDAAVWLIGEDVDVLEDRLDALGEFPGAEGMIASMLAVQISIEEMIIA